MEKISNIGIKIIAGIGILISLFLTFFSWRYTVYRAVWGYSQQIQKDSVLKNFLIMTGISAGIYVILKLMRLFTIKNVRFITIGTSVMVCAILFYAIPQVSGGHQADQTQVFYGTKWLLEGDFDSIRQYIYFHIYPFQLTFSRLQALFFRLIHQNIDESYRLMQYVNAVSVSITFYVNACIAKELFGSAEAEAVCLLCEMAFLPMFIYAFFHYGEALGVCFSVLAIYFFLLAIRERQRKLWLTWIYWMLLALSFWGICLTREALLIVAVAIAIISLLGSVQRRKISSFGITCCCILLALGGNNLWNCQIEEQTGIPFDEGAPLALWIAMGLQGEKNIEAAPGSYNGYNWTTYFDNDGDAKLAFRVASEYIRQRTGEWMEDPLGMLQFFKCKMQSQWNEPSYSVFFSTNYLEAPADWAEDMWFGDSYKKIFDFLDGYQAVIYLMLLNYFLRLLLTETEVKGYLPGLALIGGFLFSLFWEAQSRYVYPYIVFALPCVAGSFVHFITETENLCRKTVKKLQLRF